MVVPSGSGESPGSPVLHQPEKIIKSRTPKPTPTSEPTDASRKRRASKMEEDDRQRKADVNFFPGVIRVGEQVEVVGILQVVLDVFCSRLLCIACHFYLSNQRGLIARLT